MKWNKMNPPPPRRAARHITASAAALAACCVNSFLISAYHFISTFQRKAQCERCQPRHAMPCPCPGREQRVQLRFKVSSRRAKVQRHRCAEREAKCEREGGEEKECQLQLPGSQFTKMPNHSGPRKSRLHKESAERRAKRERAAKRAKKEHGVKLLKSELHVMLFFFFYAKLAVSEGIAGVA